MNAATRVVSATQAYYIGRDDAGSGKRCPFTDSELAMQWTLGRESARRASRMDLRPAFRKGRKTCAPAFRKGG